MRLPVLATPSVSPDTVLARSGVALKQFGCVHAARLGGWMLDRATGQPRLVTVAHVLAPRPALVALRASDVPPPVLHERDDGPLLCVVGRTRPLARVVAAGVCDPYGRVESLDVAVVAPLDPAVVPAGEVHVEFAPPLLGQAVRLSTAEGMVRRAHVVAVAWRSHHYGATQDVLLASSEPAPVSDVGWSGTWVLDDATEAPVAMLVGEVRDHEIDGRHYTSLGCAHPLRQVARMFDLRG